MKKIILVVSNEYGFMAQGSVVKGDDSYILSEHIENYEVDDIVLYESDEYISIQDRVEETIKIDSHIYSDYGPALKNIKVEVLQSKPFNEDEYDTIIENVNFEYDKLIQSDSPYVDSRVHGDNSFGVFTIMGEKNVSESYTIELNDDEEFDFNNVYVLYKDYSDNLTEENLIDKILYIPEKEYNEIRNEFISKEKEFSDFNKLDLINHFVNYEKTILDKFRSFEFSMDTEGRGEWTHEYMAIYRQDELQYEYDKF